MRGNRSDRKVWTKRAKVQTGVLGGVAADALLTGGKVTKAPMKYSGKAAWWVAKKTIAGSSRIKTGLSSKLSILKNKWQGNPKVTSPATLVKNMPKQIGAGTPPGPTIIVGGGKPPVITRPVSNMKIRTGIQHGNIHPDIKTKVYGPGGIKDQMVRGGKLDRIGLSTLHAEEARIIDINKKVDKIKISAANRSKVISSGAPSKTYIPSNVGPDSQANFKLRDKAAGKIRKIRQRASNAANKVKNTIINSKGLIKPETAEKVTKWGSKAGKVLGKTNTVAALHTLFTPTIVAYKQLPKKGTKSKVTW
tara:strand:+ start:416 stop:1333 length:918 start_codon:yes stop_codon:yes gene_type:complete